MKRILVTGVSGQLGLSIQNIQKKYTNLDFVFMNSKELNITNLKMVQKIFESGNFDYCINCAAYTNVEGSEKNPEKAFAVNAEGVKYLAKACSEYSVILVHISTDYVFDGKKQTPYLTKDETNPINVYGASKLLGEKYLQEILTDYYIIRTSWLYSNFGKNFYKTILQKALKGEILRVANNQTGCPTKASNLAKYVLEFIFSKDRGYGIYHYTDGDVMTWYGFAKRILQENNLDEKVMLEEANNYPTLAKRPKYSVLSMNYKT